MLTSRHLAIYFGGFTGPLGGLAVLALLPVLKQDFSVGIDLIQLSIPFFMLPFALFQLFSGTVSDRIGRGGLVTGGFLVHALGSFMCAFAPDLWVFLAGRFVQGLGYAFVSPVLNAIIGDITEKGQMGSAMGLFGSAITLGIATGPLVAGLLEQLDWRLAFHLFAALSLLEIGLLYMAFGKDFAVSKDRPAIDMTRSVRKVLGNRNVILLCAAGFLAFFAFIGPQTYMADRYSLSFTAQEIGYILSAAGFSGVFWAPLAGRMVDSSGRVPVGAAGFAVLTCGILMLGFAWSLGSFIVTFCIIGIGSATIWSSLLTLTVELVPKLKGMVSSVFNSFRFFGYALATPLFLGIYLAFDILMVYAVGALVALAGLVTLKSMRFREPVRH